MMTHCTENADFRVPDRPDESSGNKNFESFKARIIRGVSFSLSIPSFSIVLSVVPVIITALTIVLVMSSLYSKSIDEFAESSANALSSQAASNVVAILQTPYSVVDELQYTFLMENMQLPTEQKADTTRALQNLETLVDTHNVSDLSIAPLRNVVIFQSNNTLDKIKTSFLSAMRQSGGKCPNLRLTWKDRTIMSSDCSSDSRYNFVTMLPNTSDSSGLMPTITFEVDRATGRNITTTQQSSPPLSVSSSAWYLSHMTLMNKIWSATTIANPIRPAVSLTGALYNNAGRFLGVAGYSFSMEQLTNMLRNTPRPSESKIYLVSVSGRVIGSSTGKPCFTSETYYPVNEALPLSKEDIVLNMCSYAKETNTKHCLHSIASYGDRNLIDVREKLSDKIYFANTLIEAGQEVKTSFLNGKMPDITKITNYEGDATYVSWLSLSYPGALGLDWSLIVILPANRVNEVRLESLKWSFVIALLLIITITVVVGVFARRALRPLSTIVELMSFSAYLHDVADVEESTENGGSEKRAAPRLSEKMRLQLSDRTLSRWTEVRGIQKAYWSMSEELRALKAYIPEHLRDEVIAMHKANKPKSVPVKSIANFEKAKEEELKNEGISGVKHEYEIGREVEVNDAFELKEVKNFTDLRGAIGFAEEKHTTLKLSSNFNSAGVDGANSTLFTPSTFEDVSEARTRAVIPTGNHEHPIFFADNVLVDRDITMVHINIVKFHHYASTHPGVTISRDYQEFISFIHKEARRYGGILESFSGDKIWVSFNASSKCLNHPIAAAYFAFHVTSCINNAVIAKARMAANAILHPTSNEGLPATSTSTANSDSHHYFAITPYGINSGVATGRAWVGPLGNAAIKRHTIISNAMSEAVALERQAKKFPGCNVLVGGDMIPAIEGYCQYLLVDVALLPGSNGWRRRIAGLKGPMVDPKCDMEHVRRWLPPDEVIPIVNRFKTINEAMNAFLEGQYAVCRTFLDAALCELNDVSPSASFDFLEHKACMGIVHELLHAFLDTKTDGRVYQAAFGEPYAPFTPSLTLAND